MADYALPVLTSLYSDMVSALKDRDTSIMKMFEGTTDSNLPIGTKRWNGTNSYFEKFDGSAWSPLVAKYMINVDLLDGCTVNDGGSTASDLWTASKITTQLGTKLDASAYTASDILTKIKTVDGSGSGLDADLLDGMNVTSGNTGSTVVSRDASGNFSAGTITATLSGGASTLLGDESNWVGYRSRAVANMLSWKNYGNGHVIFDASNSTAPNGAAVNNTNTAAAWGAGSPTLMGWNGTSTYGVRVDSARIADVAGRAYPKRVGDVDLNFNWSGQGGQPPWLWGGSDGVNMYVYNPSNFSVDRASYLKPISGPASYKLAYTADSQRTNAGEWGRVVMHYDGNGQTYGVRCDRADYADSAGNGGVTSVNGMTGAVSVTTTPTSDQVANATASLGAGVVGTYMFAACSTVDSMVFGSTTAGSTLVPIGVGNAVNTSGLVSRSPTGYGPPYSHVTGTWRCMGYAKHKESSVITLWLRIA